MFQTGDLAVPQINGFPYLEKPPLTYIPSWLSCMAAGHVSAGMIRLPAALAGLICLALLFITARRFYGEPIAWLCTWLGATTLNFYAVMHRASSDSIALLSCFVCFALFARNLDGKTERDQPGATPSLPTWLTDAPLALALGVSFFVKNFYTFLIVVPPIVIFLLWSRQGRRLVHLGTLTLAILFVLVLPWAYVLYQRGGSTFLRVVFFDNTIGRYFSIANSGLPAAGPLDDVYTIARNHGGTFWMLSTLAMLILPWALIQLGALWSIMRTPQHGHQTLFLKIALASIVVSLGLSSSTSPQYYLPLLFPLHLATGEFLQGAYAEGAHSTKWRGGIIEINFALITVAVAVLPVAAGLFPQHPLLRWLWAPAVLGAMASGLLLSRNCQKFQRLGVTAFVLSAIMSLLLSASIPFLDTTMSSRPFFDQISGGGDSRQIWTTILDDRRLPAMTFYLNRRLRIVESPAQLAALLRSDEKIGVVMSPQELAGLRSTLAGITYKTQSAPSGKNFLVYVTNH